MGNNNSNYRKQATKAEQKILKEFGQKIKRIRAEKKLTLEKCEELGFPSWRNLSDIENGQNCTLLTIIRIAQTFKINIRDLF